MATTTTRVTVSRRKNGTNTEGQTKFKQRNLEIKELYLSGTPTMQEIGDKYGITRQRVQTILAEQGVSGIKKPRKRNVDTEVQRKILDLAGSTLTIEQIASKLEIPKYRVTKTLREAGINKSTKSQRAAILYGGIVDVLRERPDYTYGEVAVIFKVSEHTVNRAAKVHGYTRPWPHRAWSANGHKPNSV